VARTDKEILFKVKVQDDTDGFVDKTVSSLEDLEQAAKDAEDALKKAPLGTKAFKDAKDAVDQNTKALENAQTQAKGFGQSMTGLPGPLGSAAQGVKGLGTAFKALLANPVVLVISGIVAALAGLFKAFTSTKEGGEALDRVMAGVGAVMDVLRDTALKLVEPIKKIFTDPKQALEDFATGLKENILNRFEGILNLIPSLGEAVSLVFKGEFKEAGKVAFDAVAQVTTGVENASDKIAEVAEGVAAVIEEASEEADVAAEATGRLQELTDAQRDLNVRRAEQNRLIDEAKEKVNDETLSYEERLAALEEAGQKEQELADEQERIARERLEQLQILASQSDSDAETLDQLAEAEIAVANAAAESARKRKEISDQQRALLAREQADKDAAAAEDEQRRKQEEEQAEEDRKKKEQEIKDEEDRQARIAEIIRKNQEELTLAAIENEQDRAEKVAELQYEADLREIEALDATEEEKQKLRDQANQRYLNSLDEVNAEREKKQEDADEKDLEARKANNELILKSSLSLVNTIGDILTQAAGDDVERQKKAFKANKAIGISTTLINTSVAAIDAAKNTVGGPVAKTLAVAAIIAQGVAQVASIAAQKFPEQDVEDPGAGGGGLGAQGSTFEQGGMLRGRRHAQGGIMTPMGELEGGEFVVNRNATSSFLPLLEAINSSGQGTQSPSGNMSSAFENQMSQPQVIKTYVVAEDMTSTQEANKRVSDLARL